MNVKLPYLLLGAAQSSTPLTIYLYFLHFPILLAFLHLYVSTDFV
jgi:hypothetical protein